MNLPILTAKIHDLAISDKRYRVAKGGRGSGKSYGIAQVLAFLGLIEPGIRILCTRETQNSLSDSTLAVLKRVIDDMGYSAGFEPTKHGLRTIYGTEYIFRGLQNPDRIKSLDEIKYCWVAEAQRVSEDAWDMLVPTIRAENSVIWVDFNPDHAEDPVAQRFVEHPREDTIVRHITYKDNWQFFPDVLKQELEYDFRTDPERADWVWNGAYRTISEALVFRGRYFIDTFDTPGGADFYYGVDWGFSQDPTTLIRCYISDNILYIDYEAYGLGVEIDHLPALFDRVPGSRKWKLIADSQRPDTISYMRRNGFRIYGARKGKGSVEDGIEHLKSFEKIIIHSRCRHTIDEFQTYSYERDRITGEPTPKLEDKNNHLIDSLRYALQDVRKGSTVIALTGRLM